MWFSRLRPRTMGSSTIGKVALALAVASGSVPASAFCWIGGNSEVRELQRWADDNPKQALPAIERKLSRARKGGPALRDQVGWLLGTRSAAALLVSDFALAQKSAEEGLALARSLNDDSLEIEMLMRRLLIEEPSLSKAGIEASLERLATLKDRFPAQSRENICAATAMSVLYVTLGDTEAGLKLAGAAYRNAKRSGISGIAAFPTLMLSVIILTSGDTGEAEALAKELENLALRNESRALLLHAIFQRAQIAVLEGRNEAAAKAFVKVSRLAPEIGMPAADGAIGACENYVMIAKGKEALPFCRMAAQTGDKGQLGKEFRSNQLLADALLQTGRVAEATALLDRLIAMDVPPQVAGRYDRALELRALAHSLSGEFAEAYKLQLQASTNAAKRDKLQRKEEIAKLRAQFAWDRQRIANAELERDLAKAAAQARVRQTWLMTAIGWSLLLAAMLGWIVYSSRRHRRRLEALADEARGIARSKAELLSTMSHEIRSPLGSLTLAASNLASSKDIPPTSKDKAQRVSFAAERLLRQLEDLLLFTRLDAKQLPLAVQAFEPQTLVERSVSLVTDQARNVGMTISVVVHDNSPVIVEGDAGRVSQIVSNLLENAIKYSGGDRVIVSVAPLDSERFLIEVADNGHGMPPENRRKAMERFVQVSKAPSSGFGLGLSICNGLAELMGGILALEETPGGGLTARLTLPITGRETFVSQANVDRPRPAKVADSQHAPA